MRIRTAMATAALPCLLLALGACGGEAAVQPDDQYTRQLEGHGVVPAYLSREAAIDLGRDLCTRYENGETFVDILAGLASSGIPGAELGHINEAATAAYCPDFTPAW